MFDWIVNTFLLNFAKMEWFQKKNPAQKMKFSTKDVIIKCDQIRSFFADTEQILCAKLHFQCSRTASL